MRLLAIDPGNTESAYVIIDADTRRPLDFGKVSNDELLSKLWGSAHTGWLDPCEPIYIEMIGHYGTGMPAGKTVFDTCVWIGRFIEAAGSDQSHGDHAELVLRPTVKAHLCGSAKAKDANVAQALVDRFAPGQPNHGKGTKAAPGWFHGFFKDIPYPAATSDWWALCLACDHLTGPHADEAGAQADDRNHRCEQRRPATTPARPEPASHGHQWTEREDDIVRHHSQAEACRLLGLGSKAVTRRRADLGMTEPRHRWTAAQDEIVATLDPAEAAQRLALTVRQVTHRRSYLRKRGGMDPARRWTPGGGRHRPGA